MRVMYDSTTAADIPTTATMVAGYIDGVNPWSAQDWARFPNAIKIRIARNSLTNDGHVLDVERGDAQPQWAPAWATMRRRAGAVPCCYVNRANWVEVARQFYIQHVNPPLWWIATLDGTRIPFGNAIIACQYAGQNSGSGGHFDLSDVADYWPGVDIQMSPEDERKLLAEVGDLHAAVARIEVALGTAKADGSGPAPTQPPPGFIDTVLADLKGGGKLAAFDATITPK